VETYLASELDRLIALPLDTKGDLDSWESQRVQVEQTLHEKFPDFEPSDIFWHFVTDADIRLRDMSYREYQHGLISRYVRRLRNEAGA
jgi:hypothetical protein